MQHLKIFESFDDEDGLSHEERFKKLLKQGYHVEYRFAKDSSEIEEIAMQNLFPKIKDFLTPQLQNCCIYDQNGQLYFFDTPKSLKKMKKTLNYYVTPIPTIGRYTIDSSKQFVIKDLAKAKTIFKGKNNYAWGFNFADGNEISIIISHSGKFFTLVQEQSSCMLPKLFTKLDDYYLTEGWVKEDRLLEILHQIDKKVAPLYINLKN